MKNFNDFLLKMLDLVNNSSNDISIKLASQKGHVIDVLVSVDDDVVADTSLNVIDFSKEVGKAGKIIDVIREHC